jgi:hypothetical protein
VANAALTAAKLWVPLDDAPEWAQEVCPLCSHPLRDDIDERLVNGAPKAAIAREFETTAALVKKHADHLSRQLSRSILARQEVRAERLVQRVLDVDHDAKQLAATAEDGKTAVAAMNTRLRAIDLLGKITGVIRPEASSITKVNAVVNVSGDELRKMAQDVLATAGPPTPLLPPSKSHDPSSARKAPTIIDVF